MRSSQNTAAAVLLLMLAGVGPGLAGTAPKLTLAERSFTGSGFTPGGQVAWLGAGRAIEEYYATLVHPQGTVAADAQGAVAVPLDRPVPPLSVWVAVDLTTGAYAVAAPAGSPVRQVNLPPNAFRPGAGAGSDFLTDRRHLVQALLVRPGQGAWQQTVGDGGEADEDGQGDGFVQLSLARMLPLAAAPAPAKALAQDLLVVLDAEKAEVSILHPGAGR
jgi:hypothetical protein